LRPESGKTNIARYTGRDLDGNPGAAALIAASLTGDLQAYQELYRLYVGQISMLTLRMTADSTRAEILTQDVFVRAWRKLGTFRGEAPFGAWLRRLAVNVIIEDGRRQARIQKQELGGLEQDDLDQIAVRGDSLIRDRDDAAMMGTRIDLERAIRALPRGAREAFVLHDLAGFTHREIGEMSELAEGTVKAQLHRARNLLRRSLRERGGGP
jgi:RNA polymerase sigma-70 factor, ECF subfamily